MSAGHTPGPWVVGPVDDTVVTHMGKDGVRYEIASIDGDYNQPDEWPVMEANARLIAAAPDLLEALLTKRDYVADAAAGALTYQGSGDGFIAMAKEDLARIDAVIARATGDA